jgi:para-nitrobenzyl esterase
MPDSSKRVILRPSSADAGLMSASRRDIMKTLAFATLATGFATESAATPVGAEYPKMSPATGDSISASSSGPYVETEYGRIRGYVRNGIHTFKGIPYGADTSGANRFMPPQKPATWAGIRSCLYHGSICPQPMTSFTDDEYSWLFSFIFSTQDEDCLHLNVWTPGLDNDKRPVVVWIHGGRFSTGSAIELPSYDGENLARRGDEVVVSVNHRLNVLGYLNLAAFGDKFALSGNAGMLDLVAALEWVRDNISNFGGDPGNVTLIGQSGGGGKISTLMAMPTAKGLFHRAILQSGSLLTTATMESSNDNAEILLKHLNLGPADVDKLQQIPVDELEKAAMVVDAPGPPMRTIRLGMFRQGISSGWGPVAGNAALPEQPFDPKAPDMSASVSMLIGSNLNEHTNGVDKPDCFKMTAEEMEGYVRDVWKDKAGEIVATARRMYPNANNFQVLSAIGGTAMRIRALEQLRRKAAQQAAPVYCYRFDWQTPVLDGRPMALHAGEMAFVFDNTARAENLTGNGPAARALAAKMSDAWIHFARNGDPNHAGIPRWKPFNSDTSGTMVFDNECAYRDHLDDELIKLVND